MNPNLQKRLIIEREGQKYARYPIKADFITSSDDLSDIIEDYVIPLAKEGDIIVLCQKIVSITQGRIVKKEEVEVGFFANFLSKFVSRTPAGFGVGNPYKMQLAINLAGLPRILLAAVFGGIVKLFGKKGFFYKAAGNKISEIDGFYGEAFSQYEDIGILGPKNCNEICDKMRRKFNFAFAIADVNDLGGNILGVSEDLKEKQDFLLSLLKDNPAGQSDQQTPIIIIRTRGR